jgi:hypothetical protein
VSPAPVALHAAVVHNPAASLVSASMLLHRAELAAAVDRPN